MHIAHQLKIGSDTWRSTANSRLVRLVVRASMDVPVNECRFEMALPEDIAAAPNDDISIELGYDDTGRETVFTGQIESAEWEIDRLRVHAMSSFRRLAAGRVNLFFEKSKAGDLVSDVCSEFDVTTGSVNDGLDFPQIALPSNRSAYENLRQLARKCGFDFYADENDEAQFVRPLPLGGLPKRFEFGKNILAFRLENPEPNVTGVDVFGESPASFGQGNDAASWLTKRDVKGSAGDASGQKLRLFDPAARTVDGALLLAQGVLKSLETKKRGVLTTTGDATLRIGGLINVSAMPASDQNGVYKIIGFEHRIEPRRGFLTRLFLKEN